MIQSGNYSIKINNFEGPLDLLCHLIDKNKMDINNISIVEIADQYIDYINSMEKMDLEVTGEFIIMASNLIYIKSKSLLPVEKEEVDEIDPQEELINRLKEYKKFKEASKILRERMEEYKYLYYKEPELIKFEANKCLDVTYPSDLLPETFLKLSQDNLNKINHSASDINRLVQSEKVTVRSKIKEILKQLITHKSFAFNKVFTIKKKSKVEIVTAFLAMLELNKANKINVTQSHVFGDILVEKKGK